MKQNDVVSFFLLRGGEKLAQFQLGSQLSGF